jgi:hypothetical protein
MPRPSAPAREESKASLTGRLVDLNREVEIFSDAVIQAIRRGAASRTRTISWGWQAGACSNLSRKVKA